MEFITVKKPDAINFIFGQTHFIKTVEDIHETLAAAVPGQFLASSMVPPRDWKDEEDIAWCKGLLRQIGYKL